MDHFLYQAFVICWLTMVIVEPFLVYYAIQDIRQLARKIKYNRTAAEAERVPFKRLAIDHLISIVLCAKIGFILSQFFCVVQHRLT